MKSLRVSIDFSLVTPYFNVLPNKKLNCVSGGSKLRVVPEDQTLYHRVIGDDFERLPIVLREFHSRANGGEARGVVKVMRGRGWLQNCAAWALRLPPVGERVAVTLQVRTIGEREIWIRCFNGQRVETTQWQEGEYLVEQAGPLRFVFRVEANEEEMRFHFAHNKIGNLKLPFPLLRVNATARGDGAKWHIQVMISAPLLGMLTQYSGEIAPC
jgi:hypothetical protein